MQFCIKNKNKVLKNKKIILKLFIFIFLTFLFWLAGTIFLDPDLWWHFKMGEILSTSGFPASDPFSYSMPSYKYADHEWLAEILMIKTYQLFGIPGLSLIFGLITAIALFLIFPLVMTYYELAIFAFAGSILLSFAGIRIQTTSWLFFVIVLLIIQQGTSKLVLLVPFVFLLWANIHAGFITGLFLVFLLFVQKSLNSKKIRIDYLLLFILSTLVTLINPYGIALWQEIWSTSSDSSLRWSISEWLPIFISLGYIYLWLWLIFTSYLILRYFKKITFLEKSLYIVFLLLSISSVRNFPFYLLATLPISLTLFRRYFLEVEKNNSAAFLKKILVFTVILFSSIALTKIASYFNITNINTHKYTYPIKAVSFLKEEQSQGRLFAEYRWGGYLIWKLPEKKVFIDGRMPSWKQNSMRGESANALEEYLNTTLVEDDLNIFFEKYDISLVLWSNDKLIGSDLSNPFVSLALKIKSIHPSKKTFIERVRDLGWKKIYEDESALIYQKN